MSKQYAIRIKLQNTLQYLDFEQKSSLKTINCPLSSIFIKYALCCLNLGNDLIITVTKTLHKNIQFTE